MGNLLDDVIRLVIRLELIFLIKENPEAFISGLVLIAILTSVNQYIKNKNVNSTSGLNFKLKENYNNNGNNISEIREGLNKAFGNAKLDAFCLDYFISIYDTFTQGTRKDEKIQLLLDHCRRQPTGFKTLLIAVQKAYQVSNPKSNELLPLIKVLSK